MTKDDAFLETPAVGGNVVINLARAEEPARYWIGKRVGEFLITEMIAHGGMGAVFKAVQRDPERLVALKLMRSGLISHRSRQRFHYESQILGRLEHPNIAQIYGAGEHHDAGESLPFFAMQFITDALPITRFASDHNLPLASRLELFAKVCDAVQHGHQKGIIHRDLKPANILVDSLGEPKVIDFGVAKATDANLMLTLEGDTHQLIGTLQYMSPEQLSAPRHDGLDRDQEIDTRSDVYGLGVVLYELLCGQPPYSVANLSIPEATRIIREQAPPRPSIHRTRLRGDLETIMLKAIEKEPDRRYPSASDLAGDIRRFLNHEPVRARPSSTIYQVRRFARRHRAFVSAAVAGVLVLLLGIIATSW